jgi:transposase-like protein
MAKLEQFKLNSSERRRRTFSANFKKEKVREIELGTSSVSDICKAYEVSDTSVYRWLEEFGTQKNKPERIILESKSDTKKLLELQKKVAELERLVGQKQILIDFQQKMLDLAEDYYQIDIKKKFSGSQSDISGKSEKK